MHKEYKKKKKKNTSFSNRSSDNLEWVGVIIKPAEENNLSTCVEEKISISN
jgi:hypothetical protein